MKPSQPLPLPFAVAMLLTTAGLLLTPPAGAAVQRGPSPKERAEQLMLRLKAGPADPLADAQSAIAQQEFGLIRSGFGRGSFNWAVGVQCNLGVEPPVLMQRHWGDALDDQLLADMRLYTNYALPYNRHVIADPAFPRAGRCRPNDEIPLVPAG